MYTPTPTGTGTGTGTGTKHTTLKLQGYLKDGKPALGSIHMDTRYLHTGTDTRYLHTHHMDTRYTHTIWTHATSTPVWTHATSTHTIWTHATSTPVTPTNLTSIPLFVLFSCLCRGNVDVPASASASASSTPTALLASHGSLGGEGNGKLLLLVHSLALYVLVVTTFCVCYFLGHAQWDLLILTPLIELTLFMEKNQASFEAMHMHNNTSSSSPPVSVPGATRGQVAEATAAAVHAAGKGKGKGKTGNMLFKDLRRISAENLLEANAEWLTGMLVLIWELWRPWLDALVGGAINNATPLINADVCSFGGAPLLCKAVESRKRGDISPLSYELDLKLEWASDLYIRISLNLCSLFFSSPKDQNKQKAGGSKGNERRGGIPLVTVSGLHLNMVVRASLKLTDVDERDYAMFPNLAKMAISLAKRPELDLQLRLLGMVDLLALPGVSMIKGLIVDFLCNMMGPQADGSLKAFEIMDDSFEKAAIHAIEQTRKEVTPASALWDFKFTPDYRREGEALLEHVHVLVVRVLFATDLSTNADCKCILRYGVGADDKSLNDFVEYHSLMPSGAGRNVWHEEHSFLVRSNSDLLQIELRDKSGKRVSPLLPLRTLPSLPGVTSNGMCVRVSVYALCVCVCVCVCVCARARARPPVHVLVRG
jgi:hypothetical protein